MPNINDRPLKVSAGNSTHIHTSDGIHIAAAQCMDFAVLDMDVSRRLVACWNACLGMSTESLESMPGHYFGAVHEQRKLTAEQQRDELLAAIERISSYVDPLTGNDAKAMREIAKSARDKVLGD